MSEQVQVIILNVLPILVLFLVAYFFMIRPAQKRNREQQQLMKNLEKGQKVTTIGGIHGTVKLVDNATVTIAVNNKGQELTLDKAAIKEVRPS